MLTDFNQLEQRKSFKGNFHFFFLNPGIWIFFNNYKNIYMSIIFEIRVPNTEIVQANADTFGTGYETV